MLAMGFIEDVEAILKVGEAQRDMIQTLLFSATLPKWVQSLTKRFLRPGHCYMDLVGDQRMQVRHVAVAYYQILREKGRTDVSFTEQDEMTPDVVDRGHGRNAGGGQLQCG